MSAHISIITLGVKELEKSFAFYTALGFPSKGIQGDIVFFELPGTWLALHPRDQLAADVRIPEHGTGFCGITLAHNVKSTQDVDALMDKAKKIGATITDPAHEREWGGYSGYFRDLDGFVWEIAWNPHLPIA